MAALRRAGNAEFARLVQRLTVKPLGFQHANRLIHRTFPGGCCTRASGLLPKNALDHGTGYCLVRVALVSQQLGLMRLLLLNIREEQGAHAIKWKTYL